MDNLFAMFLPGLMVMWVLFIAQNALNDLFVEQENKSLRRICVAPVTVNQYVLSKLLYCFLLCFISEALVISASWLLFGMSWGNLIYLLAILGASNLCFVGVMALMFSLSKSRDSASALTAVVILLSSAVGGSLFPYDQLPRFMQEFGEYLFIRWSIAGIEHVIRGDSLQSLFNYALALVVMGVATLALGAFLFQRRIESGEF